MPVVLSLNSEAHLWQAGNKTKTYFGCTWNVFFLLFVLFFLFCDYSCFNHSTAQKVNYSNLFSVFCLYYIYVGIFSLSSCPRSVCSFVRWSVHAPLWPGSCKLRWGRSSAVSCDALKRFTLKMLQLLISFLFIVFIMNQKLYFNSYYTFPLLLLTSSNHFARIFYVFLSLVWASNSNKWFNAVEKNVGKSLSKFIFKLVLHLITIRCCGQHISPAAWFRSVQRLTCTRLRTLQPLDNSKNSSWTGALVSPNNNRFWFWFCCSL